MPLIKFAAIERLLEKEVTKSPVPEEFGETPAYNPGEAKASKPGGGGFKGKKKVWKKRPPKA